MSAVLDDLLARINRLPAAEAKELIDSTLKETAHMRWVPNPGPQTQAYHSKAFITLFGGNPGGGKSALEIGLAVNEHTRSLIVRKNFSDLEGLMDNAKKMLGTSDGFVGGARPKYKKPDGGVVHFAGLAQDGGIGGHQGVDHDLICVDEAATVPESQVRLLIGWCRTEIPGQRCRIVLASNPPLDAVGDWLVDFFAPWLDETHPNPAKPGELRWFMPGPDGKDIECKEGDTAVISGIETKAHSRTYIPSKFTDNPFYDPQTYAATLALLPDEKREILSTGNFMLARKSDPWQMIPTAWIKAAQDRWTEKPPDGVPMCAMGADVAQGGDDNNILAPRYDGWYAPLVVVPGKLTPLGTDMAGLIVAHRRDKAKVIIDCGGGYGGSAYKTLKENEIDVEAYKGTESTEARTEDSTMGFFNTRAAAYWKFREALNPATPGGSTIRLPRDTRILSDLAAPTYCEQGGKIKMEPKDQLVKRIGRSTDFGDAVVMAWWRGQRMADSYQIWKDRSNHKPKVNMSHRSARRRH